MDHIALVDSRKEGKCSTPILKEKKTEGSQVFKFVGWHWLLFARLNL